MGRFEYFYRVFCSDRVSNISEDAVCCTCSQPWPTCSCLGKCSASSNRSCEGSSYSSSSPCSSSGSSTATHQLLYVKASVNRKSSTSFFWSRCFESSKMLSCWQHGCPRFHLLSPFSCQGPQREVIGNCTR